jgi:hypothetical protein
MSGCLADRDDGTLCRAPATIPDLARSPGCITKTNVTLDHQSGGLVCLRHVPDEIAAEITRSRQMGITEGRLDNEGEVYTSNMARTSFTSVGS